MAESLDVTMLADLKIRGDGTGRLLLSFRCPRCDQMVEVRGHNLPYGFDDIICTNPDCTPSIDLMWFELDIRINGSMKGHGKRAVACVVCGREYERSKKPVPMFPDFDVYRLVKVCDCDTGMVEIKEEQTCQE